MKILSRKDVLKIITSKCLKNENLAVYAGRNGAKQPVISKGLKIKHTQSGLVYTVIDFIEDGEGPKILCQRPGKKLLIQGDMLKDYERQ